MTTQDYLKQVKRFEVGKRYIMRSVCDHDCIWMYEVISRTDSTVVLQEVRYGKPFGDMARFRIKKKLTDLRGVEKIMPMGSYSMAPVLSADEMVAAK